MVEAWDRFLDSLATKGGNLAMLGFFTFILLGFVVHVSYHAVFGPEIRTLAISSFSGFSGALLNALIGAQRNGKTGETHEKT